MKKLNSLLILLILLSPVFIIVSCNDDDRPKWQGRYSCPPDGLGPEYAVSCGQEEGNACSAAGAQAIAQQNADGGCIALFPENAEALECPLEFCPET